MMASQAIFSGMKFGLGTLIVYAAAAFVRSAASNVEAEFASAVDASRYESPVQSETHVGHEFGCQATPRGYVMWVER